MTFLNGRKVSILVTGATGYIGGAVLTALLNSANRSSYEITALIRAAEKAPRLTSLGVHPVIGSHDEERIMRPLVAASDVVISVADSDNLEAARIMVDGAKDRKDRTGTAPILIHTSGTALLNDDARGMYVSSKIYSDLDLAALDSLPSTQPHRLIDLAILDADALGHVRAFLIVPGTVYGRSTGVLPEEGVSRPMSQQVPRLAKIGLQRGSGPYVGKGVNLWPNVEIHELTQLYLLILERALGDESFLHGREGIFFGENGEHSWHDVAKRISETLYDLDLAQDQIPTPLTPNEIEKWWGPGQAGEDKVNGSYGSNSRCRADRGRKLGWQPVKETDALLQNVKEEVEIVAKEPRS